MSNTTRGVGLRRRAQGVKSDRLQRLLVESDPDVARWMDEFVFDEVWGRGELEFDERMLIAIACLGMQNKDVLLANYIHGALQEGMSARKIHETVLMLVVYAGFPTGISMLQTWRSTLASARKQGVDIVDDLPQTST